MTGPEHYRAAEQAGLHAADLLEQQKEDGVVLARIVLAEAQVHATLALAAATAEHVTAATYDSWWAAVGGPERAG